MRYFDRNEGAYYETCPECKGSGMDCDEDWCDESCWWCHGCGVVKHCTHDLCDEAVSPEWCT